MASRGIASFVTALFACGVTAIHADVSEGVRVDIRLHVDRSITSRRTIMDCLKFETEAIWRPYGILLKWTDADASEPAANSISLDASIERRFEKDPSMEWAVLGRVVAKPDAPILPPIRVSFDATESVVALGLTGRASTTGIVLVTDRELARALGRVLAHEIGHVLIGEANHDRAGLMRAAFRSDELAEPDRAPFRLACGRVGPLRSRLRALTGNPLPARQRDSTTLEIERFRDTKRESAAEGSCILG